MDPANSKPDKVIIACAVLTVLNTWLVPWISDPYVYQEFLSNNLVLVGICVIYWVSTKFTYSRKNFWVGITAGWVGLASKLSSPDPMNLPLEIFLLVYIKAQIINLLCWIIGLGCLYIIGKSVYYDGILVIWNFFLPRSQQTYSEQLEV